MAADTRDPPMDEPNFVAGLTVVDIGDYRVSRGLTRRAFSGCHHRRLTYDSHERRIWCRDCERDVEPFDAFVGICEQYSGALRHLDRRQKAVEEAEQFQLRSRAAKAVDEVWRGRSQVPMCPHCRLGLMPEHFVNGISTLGRDYARAMIAKRKDQP